jgi:hypothetical protein
MRIIIRSGDARNFLDCLKETGFFEYGQWGSVVRFEYHEKDEYPIKLLFDGKLQPEQRFQELQKFVFNNRKNINIQIKKLQGKRLYPSNKYIHLDRGLFEDMYKEAYKRYLKRPTQNNTGYYNGLEAVATKVLAAKELELLRAQAVDELQAEKEVRKKGLKGSSTR